MFGLRRPLPHRRLPCGGRPRPASPRRAGLAATTPSAAWALALGALLCCASAGRASGQPPTRTQRWRCSGAAWRGGDLEGVVAVASHLVLPAGGREGRWRRVLPEGPPFDRLLVTLEPERLGTGDELRLRVRVHVDGAWTPWLPLGVYGPGEGLPRSERSSPVRGVRVATDLVCSARPASAAEVLLEFRGRSRERPRVRALTACRWLRGPPPPRLPQRSPAWGRELRGVPRRSQRVEDPAIASRICSPTSLAMVLAFHGHDLPTAAVAREVYDHRADIYGNWAFNVAYAASLGLRAAAVHCDGFAELEREILAGRPAVISHRYRAGELHGAPVDATEGHLIVVIGFTADGDVIVHDPAAPPESVRRVYARDELRRSWLERGEGIAYFIAPEEG